MNLTYITTKELAERIHYNERTIRNQLKDIAKHLFFATLRKTDRGGCYA